MAVACPFCQSEIQEDKYICPCCSKSFEEDWKDVWPKEAYSTDGLQPHLILRKALEGDSKDSGGDSFTIGRDSDDDWILTSETVSRRHVKVELVDNVWIVRRINKDFYHNGNLITQSAELHCGDKLIIGGVLINVEIRYKQRSPRVNNSDEQLEIENPKIITLNNKSRITIGSSNSDDEYDIVVKSQHKFKVLLYKYKGNWWIADSNSPYEVKVNDERIRNKKLDLGDRISIANVAFICSVDGLKPTEGSSAETIIIQTEGLGASIRETGILDKILPSWICKLFSKKTSILENINIQAKPKEFIGILGPSGSGKTSLIQRLIGLATITKGDCRVNGKSLKTKECKKAFLSNCAYLPQDVALHKSITVQQEMDCFCDLHNSDCSHDNIPYALKKVGLEDKLDERVGSLSGGQQKRLGIAMELLRFPSALLLDEPTSGLDFATGTEVMEYLKKLAQQGKTVLCTTHQIEFFDKFDKVVILSRGRLVFFGSPVDAKSFFKKQDFFEHKSQDLTPQDIYTQLADGSIDEQIERANRCAENFAKSAFYEKVKKESDKIDEDLKKQTSGDQKKLIKTNFGSSFTRFVKSFILQFWGYLKRRIFIFWQLENLYSSLIQILILPLLISLTIKLACASKWWTDGSHLFFFCLISMFWFGMNNSIRELVSERIPWRCLERLERVSMFAYILSKAAWTALLCIFQTLVFGLITFQCFILRPGYYSESLYSSPVVCWSPWMFIILFFTSYIGVWIAMAVSAWCKESSLAVSMLPIILIPVLLFSRPVMTNMHEPIQLFNINESKTTTIEEDNKKNNKKDLSLAIFFYKISPCAAPLSYITAVNSYNYDQNQYNLRKEECYNDYLQTDITEMKEARFTFWIRFAIWVVVLFGITYWKQRSNELAWEGR